MTRMSSRKKFLENDLWLAASVKELKKEFIFIRTNVDADIENERNDHPETFDERSVIERIRISCLESIRTVDRDAEVYLISGHLINRFRFDFSKLNERLIRDFPSLKREAMILSMSVLSKEILLSKIGALKRRIWIVASASGAVAAVPVPFLSIGFDITLVLKEIEFYRKQLGLEVSALEKISRVYGIPMNRLEKELESIFPLKYLTSIRAFVIDLAKRQALSTTTEEFARFVPYVGTIVASALSFSVCFFVLYKVLIRMQQAALKIIDIAIDATK